MSTDPEKIAAGEMDVEKLRAELVAERRSRAWLESRLEELDQRLRRSQAAERAHQTAAAQDQVAVLGLHASLTAEAEKESAREELDLWFQVAALHAEAATPALPAAATVRVETITIVREPAVDSRYEQKLSTARAAVETAEARAAHQAAQVRRLSEELAASRVEQTRALNRIQELEKKLLRIEARAELLDSAVGERMVEKSELEFGLPAEAIAPLEPAKPSLVYTETEHGTQLAPLVPETLEDDAASPPLEEFEPKPRAQATEAPAPEGLALADAFADLFGEDPSAADLEIVPAPAQTPPADAPASGDAIAEALEMWGGGPAVTFDAPSPQKDEDPFAGLATALDSLSAAPLEMPAAPAAARADDDDPFGGLANALEEITQADAVVMEEIPARMDDDDAPTPPAEAAPGNDTETILIDALPTRDNDAPADLYRELEVAAEERKRPASEQAPSKREQTAPMREQAAPRRERPAAMAEALSTWSGESPAENGEEKSVPPKGRAAMVDALLRFMGPQ